jgi:hypothetical protein
MSLRLLIWLLIGSLSVLAAGYEKQSIFAPYVPFSQRMSTSPMLNIVNDFAMGNQMIGVATTIQFFVAK